MLTFEKDAASGGFRFIVGIDEAGRGPLAGPVVAAAVSLFSTEFRSAINDSKLMTPDSREKAFYEIFQRGYVGIGIVSEKAIDEMNILNATFLAMELAVQNMLRAVPDAWGEVDNFDGQVMMLVDGNCFQSSLPFAYRTIVGGDQKSLSIACASIVAKVYRDRVMSQYDRIFPQYGFKQHKGYATQEHRTAIRTHGPSSIHRRSFTWLAET